MSPIVPRHLLREKHITQTYNFSKSTLWRWVKAGHFPAPVKIGRSAFWTAEAVAAWDLRALRGEYADVA